MITILGKSNFLSISSKINLSLETLEKCKFVYTLNVLQIRENKAD